MPRRISAIAGWHRLRRRRAGPDALDFEAFFYARYRGLVRFLILSEAAGFDDAEDAVEEAMSDAFRNWATIDNPDAWVRRAARHALINQRQRERRAHRLAVVAFLAAAPAAARNTLDADQQEGRGVVELLKQLPPAQREIMALSVDGYTPAEIAEMVGKDPQTVRSNLRAARHSLATRIRSVAHSKEVSRDQ